MSISVIRAAFECDGCGKPFKVDIEPSTKNWMRRQDMLSIAENAIRGGMTRDGEFCSIQARSEERRVGKERVCTVRSRWPPDHYNKNKEYHHTTPNTKMD